VPYRGICRRAAATATAAATAAAAAAAATPALRARGLRGSQTLVARGRYWMSSRERLRAALKEPPLSHFHHHSPFFPHRFIQQRRPARASLFQPPPPARPMTCDVRRTSIAHRPPLLFTATPAGYGEASPVALKGTGSYIPFAPIFHKRY